MQSYLKIVIFAGMKRTMILLLLFFLCVGRGLSFCLPNANSNADTEKRDSLFAVFWNVENFFDYHSSSRPEYWTKRRFYSKCSAISKVIFLLSERYGSLPDLICLSEVENEFVLKSLISSTLLRKTDYKIVHFDSFDHRGMDCALLYRESSLSLSEMFPVHIHSLDGAVLPTRDLLVVCFENGLSVIVNHHPSKIGGKNEERQTVFNAMENVADSLLRDGTNKSRRVLSVGDFNEDLWKITPKGKGTIKYNGEWEQIDGYFAYGDFLFVGMEIFSSDELLTEDRTFGGMKPRRTFVGPRYYGGVSDHLPIALMLYF